MPARIAIGGAGWRYGIDGSTIRVPDNEENRAHFGGQDAGGDRDRKDRGVSGYPLVKLVTVMALRGTTLRTGPATRREAQDEQLRPQAPGQNLVEKSRDVTRSELPLVEVGRHANASARRRALREA